MVFLMVVVGGITRLTRSGLSITEWKPIAGALPPLSEAAWEREFSLYKKYPEYRLINRGMSLSEFKSIYFWEYFHRLWGRLIGLAFLVPFVVFLARGRLRGRLFWQTLVAFLLGGAQGVLGWYMVKSGLVAEPRVSHYRLAAHLVLALAVMQYLFWLGHTLVRESSASRVRGARRSRVHVFGVAFLVLLCLQILWGAFTAGLRAGYAFNTFPTMAGAWIPDGLGVLAPAWRNLFDNNVTVQFIHRTLAWLVLGTAVGWWFASRREQMSPSARMALALVPATVALQFLVGVLTLLYVVPIGLGVLHQAGAAIVLTCAVFALLELRLPTPSTEASS